MIFRPAKQPIFGPYAIRGFNYDVALISWDYQSCERIARELVACNGGLMQKSSNCYWLDDGTRVWIMSPFNWERAQGLRVNQVMIDRDSLETIRCRFHGSFEWVLGELLKVSTVPEEFQIIWISSGGDTDAETKCDAEAH